MLLGLTPGGRVACALFLKAAPSTLLACVPVPAPCPCPLGLGVVIAPDASYPVVKLLTLTLQLAPFLKPPQILVWSHLFPAGNLTGTAWEERQPSHTTGSQARRSGECPWAEQQGGLGVLGGVPARAVPGERQAEAGTR